MSLPSGPGPPRQPLRKELGTRKVSFINCSQELIDIIVIRVAVVCRLQARHPNATCHSTNPSTLVSPQPDITVSAQTVFPCSVRSRLWCFQANLGSTFPSVYGFDRHRRFVPQIAIMSTRRELITSVIMALDCLQKMRNSKECNDSLRIRCHLSVSKSENTCDELALI